MLLLISIVLLVGLGYLALIRFGILKARKRTKQTLCESVNYHFTRVCNYSCKFCFHTMKKDAVRCLDLDTAKEGLRLLKQNGLTKINFSGGEPWMIDNGRHLGLMCRFCKEELDDVKVSIVSNGSRITQQWFQEFGHYVDYLAISCDSFNNTTLERIGRGAAGVDHLRQLQQIRNWCLAYNVKFKINTVVCRENWGEDMNEEIRQLNPVRWKVFQVLLLEGENVGADALRDAEDLTITKEQFDSFIERHSHNSPVAESNDLMQNSYYILDEEMRFLNCAGGGKVPGPSIFEPGGVAAAIRAAGHDSRAFIERGGDFYQGPACGGGPVGDMEDLAFQQTT